MEIHNIPPVYDENSRILILGSFPSVVSRQKEFFYGNKNNRFWKIMALVFDSEISDNTEEKKKFLIENRIALWDVIKSCEIKGSSDSSITNVEVNDIGMILSKAGIEQIYTNGKKSEEMYRRYLYPLIQKESICLPSTSSANAQYGIDDLYEKWKMVKEVIK